MKKVFLTLAVVALLAAVSTSCKKDCYCTIKDGTTEVMPEQNVGQMTAAQCEAFDNPAWTQMGYTITCEAR